MLTSPGIIVSHFFRLFGNFSARHYVCTALQMTHNEHRRPIGCLSVARWQTGGWGGGGEGVVFGRANAFTFSETSSVERQLWHATHLFARRSRTFCSFPQLISREIVSCVRVCVYRRFAQSVDRFLPQNSHRKFPLPSYIFNEKLTHFHLVFRLKTELFGQKSLFWPLKNKHLSNFSLTLQFWHILA